MKTRFLFDGPQDAPATIILAHGAGAPMDSPAMEAAARAIAETGLRIARFEFGYMAGRRTSGGRKPPPRAETLADEYRSAIQSLKHKGKLVLGGKSMGGRVASLIADELHREGVAVGLFCLGYPFHPPAKPLQLRTAHLLTMETPTLICQGTRDPFGTREEVPGYGLPATIEILWFEDGDHDLRPRKSISGFTATDQMKTMAVAVHNWVGRLG